MFIHFSRKDANLLNKSELNGYAVATLNELNEFVAKNKKIVVVFFWSQLPNDQEKLKEKMLFNVVYTRKKNIVLHYSRQLNELLTDALYYKDKKNRSAAIYDKQRGDFVRNLCNEIYKRGGYTKEDLEKIEKKK